MRVGINLLYLLPGLTGGTGTYGLSLVESLLKIDQENEYVVFLSMASEGVRLPEAANLRRVVLPFDSHDRPQRYLREQLTLPSVSRDLGVDVLHSPGYVAPLRAPCASVVSILDLNFIVLRDLIPLVRRTALRLFVTASARAADHILTISSFSRQQIMRRLRVAPDRISVTHLAPRERKPGIDDERWQELRARYGIKGRYVAAFSSLSPHKNLARLAEAMAEVNAVERCDLLLIGNLPEGLLAKVRSHRWDWHIIVAGHVPDEHVVPLLTNSEMLVFPSWYEGFGLPVLEAQQAGTAVVCSNAAALPEVAGKGALYFDPFSTPELVRAIIECLRNQRLRANLIELGKENVRKFSWRQTAGNTLEAYKAVMQS